MTLTVMEDRAEAGTEAHVLSCTGRKKRRCQAFCYKCLVLIALACFQVIGRTVHAGTLSGSIDFGYQQSQIASNNQPNTGTATANQRYHLDYEDTLHRSWLGSYRIGGTFANTSMNRDSQNTDTKMSAFRLSGKLLPYSPFPFSWYYMDNDTDITTSSGDDSYLDTRSYGADLRLDFRQLPTMTFFHYGQETASTLTASSSLQQSDTTGITMKKRWDALTANLRFEQSDYKELHNQAHADAGRLSGSLTFRPSADFQASVATSNYDRTGNNPAIPDADPLYSDRRSVSDNLTISWNPGSRTKLELSGNTFLEDYDNHTRDAADGRASLNYQLNKYLSASASTYSVRTLDNGEHFESDDNRVGLHYSRSRKWRGWEIRENAGGGYFNREAITGAQPAELSRGVYYLLGGGISRPWKRNGFIFTPYYDLGYGHGKQTSVSESSFLSQELGARADGRALGGRLSGNISYHSHRQQDELSVISEQRRAYVDYSRRLPGKTSMRIQVGYTNTHGETFDNLFKKFVQDQETSLDTYYSRIDFSTPIRSLDLIWKTSLRSDYKLDKDQQSENSIVLDTRLSQQIGKLFYETGYYYKNSGYNGVMTSESVWFVNVKRTINARF